jgi:hypothetical protein
VLHTLAAGVGLGELEAVGPANPAENKNSFVPLVSGRTIQLNTTYRRPKLTGKKPLFGPSK